MTRITVLFFHQLKISQWLCFLIQTKPNFDDVSCQFKSFKSFDDFSMKKSYFDSNFLHENDIF